MSGRVGTVAASGAGVVVLRYVGSIDDANAPPATPNLRHRRLRPEVMDQPGLDPGDHRAALRGLARLNAASCTSASLFAAVRRVCQPPTDRPLRVLDVATGGGDVALGIWRRAERAGFAIEVHGLDFSETAVAHARKNTPAGAAVSFEVTDALAGVLPTGFDAVISTLFLHHLAEGDAVALLRRMAVAAAQAVVVSDLRRSAAGYLLAQLACRTLSRSPIVHTDGPRSVEGAFTIEEFRRLAGEAGLAGVRVEWSWPERFLATWRRTP